MERYTSQQPQTVWKKLENFWFYHKWHLLAGILILSMLVVAVHSCIKKESIDMYVLYMANGAYSTQAAEEFALKLEQYIDDIDGDGEKRVQVISVTFSDAVARTDQSQEATLSKMVGQISSGPALFYVFDEENYQALKEAQVQILAPLSTNEEAPTYFEEDRYNASDSGFFKGLKGWAEKGKKLYFGIRVSDGIEESDARFKQIEQSKKALDRIAKDHI